MNNSYEIQRISHTTVSVFSIFLLLLCNGCAQKQSMYYQTKGTILELPDAEDLRYAQIIESKLYEQYAFVQDEAVTEPLNQIARSLQKVAKRPYLQSRVHIIDSPTYANSCTGGHDIFIGRPFLDLVSTEDEKAFVIAHEMAHIDNKHCYKAFKNAGKVSWVRRIFGSLIPIGFAFIPGGYIHPVASIAAQQGTAMINSIASDIIHKGYKRSIESEADRDAVLMMLRAGYKPQAALSVISKLEQAARNPTNTLFSDHPTYEARRRSIARLIS